MTCARQLRIFQNARWITAALATAALVARAILCWQSLQPGQQEPGSPLPELTFAGVTAPGTKLPDYARLLDAVSRSEAAWEHDYTIRTFR